MTYARVYVLGVPYAIDRLYDYSVPEALSDRIRIGDIVTVPFGGGERRSHAVIASFSDASAFEKPKPILAVLDRRYQLPEELFSVALFLREHTLCTAGEAMHALLPTGILSGISERFSLPEPAPSADTSEEAALYSRLAEASELSEAELRAIFGDSGVRLARRLASRGRLLVSARPEEPTNLRFCKLYAPAEGAAERTLVGDSDAGDAWKHAEIRLRSASQRAALRFFLQNGECDAETAEAACGVTPAQLQALVEKRLLTVRRVELLRNPYAAYGRTPDRREIRLSAAQARAFDTLLSLSHEKKPRAALLYGVTGSGKTNVILRLLDEVLASGRQAIVMVPEIALTPQTVRIFCRRYGERVAVIHSSLSKGERIDAYRRINRGEVELVIGTRSAVFAPLRNIGLIVIDEEHESSYKSDQNPKYHARDVAAFRCGKQNALLVLASATPSIESFYKAERGNYTLVPLRERYGNARLPETRIVDMREELRRGNRTSLSETLLLSLRQAKEEEKQAILFLNRRGYNSAVSCRACGESILCPHCSISLTYHTAQGGYLLCHSCGYKAYPPKTCPSCQSPHLSYVGCGTEKAESELLTSLPDVKILRLDADTTGTRAAYERILQGFRDRNADILVGTQMVTKGHDFPNVTVSGVLLADASLYVNDFRAGERTFSLLTQVIGRAGRGDSAGVAIIQTYAPQNPVIRLAARQDYDAFYRDEIALRRSTLFPPFCDLVQLTLSSPDEHAVLEEAGALLQRLSALAKEKYEGLPMEVYGPFEAQVYKASGRYRMRILLKCRLSAPLRALLRELLSAYGDRRGKTWLSVDINPTSV